MPSCFPRIASLAAMIEVRPVSTQVSTKRVFATVPGFCVLVGLTVVPGCLGALVMCTCSVHADLCVQMLVDLAPYRGPPFDPANVSSCLILCSLSS